MNYSMSLLSNPLTDRKAPKGQDTSEESFNVGLRQGWGHSKASLI